MSLTSKYAGTINVPMYDTGQVSPTPHAFQACSDKPYNIDGNRGSVTTGSNSFNNGIIYQSNGYSYDQNQVNQITINGGTTSFSPSSNCIIYENYAIYGGDIYDISSTGYFYTPGFIKHFIGASANYSTQNQANFFGINYVPNIANDTSNSLIAPPYLSITKSQYNGNDLPTLYPSNNLNPVYLTYVNVKLVGSQTQYVLTPFSPFYNFPNGTSLNYFDINQKNYLLLPLLPSQFFYGTLANTFYKGVNYAITCFNPANNGQLYYVEWAYNYFQSTSSAWNQLLFDDATINSYITANNYSLVQTNYGLILMIGNYSGYNKQYFISPNLETYYLLNFVPQGPTVSLQYIGNVQDTNIAGSTYLMIDGSGTFWYLDEFSKKVYNSYGIYLSGITPPQGIKIPPLSLPCWIEGPCGPSQLAKFEY